MRTIEKVVNDILNTVASYATLTEIDPGNFRSLRVKGLMKFKVRQFDVSGIGNLALMTVDLGIMRMVTAILTPSEKDIPLYSFDLIMMPGKQKLYVEFYDLVLEMEEPYGELLKALSKIEADAEYESLERVLPAEAWYDELKTVGFYRSGKRSDQALLMKMAVEGLECILGYGEELPMLSEDEKRRKREVIREYSDGMIRKGGVSTNVFVKSLGEEETRSLFETVLFKV